MSYTQIKEDIYVLTSTAGFYAMMVDNHQTYSHERNFPSTLPNQYPCLIVLHRDDYTWKYSFTQLAPDDLVKALDLMSGTAV